MFEFTCANCDVVVKNRNPIREGTSWERLYCSFPCAWMHRSSERDLDNLCKWLSLAETWGTESLISHMVRTTLWAQDRICFGPALLNDRERIGFLG